MLFAESSHSSSGEGFHFMDEEIEVRELELSPIMNHNLKVDLSGSKALCSFLKQAPVCLEAGAGLADLSRFFSIARIFRIDLFPASALSPLEH